MEGSAGGKWKATFIGIFGLILHGLFAHSGKI